MLQTYFAGNWSDTFVTSMHEAVSLSEVQPAVNKESLVDVADSSSASDDSSSSRFEELKFTFLSLLYYYFLYELNYNIFISDLKNFCFK